VELGIPYTDPVLDGPVIQRATEEALAAGLRVADVFDVIRAVHQHAPEVPVLVMTYWNLVLHFRVGSSHRSGVADFAGELAQAGGAGLITPDLIPDEARDWLAASDAHGLDRVFLVAPSSTPARLRLTADASRGFVYAASTMGVTGTRATVGSQARQLVADTRSAGAQRVCLGLGVSNGDQAAEVGGYADGVIVGSALVRALSADRGSDAGMTAPSGDAGQPSAPAGLPWAERLARLRVVTADLAAGVARARRTEPAGPDDEIRGA
jgi:tryptophan synthase alpha chain